MLGQAAAAIGLAVAALTIGLSAHTLQNAVGSRTRGDAAPAVSPAASEGGASPSLVVSLEALSRCSTDRTYDTARREFLKLQALNPAADYDLWFEQLATADATVARAIECSPGDGFLWALRAYLMRQAVAPPDHVIDALQRSRALSPSYAGAVITRAATWWSLSADLPLDAASQKTRDTDIALFVDQAHPLLVARFLRESPAAIRDEIARLSRASPTKRRDELSYAIRISTPEKPERGPSSSTSNSSLFDFLDQRPQFD